jgi:DNA-binding NtrC family response regulator
MTVSKANVFTHDLAHGSVLLVDDEPTLRRICRRQLTAAGFEVVEAANGRIALELTRTRHFDVVVSDVRMPDMGGFELVDLLSLEAPALPVVLVSGCSDFDGVQAARDYGVVDCLVKPVALDELLRCISLALGSGHGGVEVADGEPRESETRLLLPANAKRAFVA